MIKANDPSLRSWVDVRADSDFPIQNLPFGVARINGERKVCSIIGDHVIDLAVLWEHGYFDHLSFRSNVFKHNVLNVFLSYGRKNVSGVRNKLSELLAVGNESLQGKPQVLRSALVPLKDVSLCMPVDIPDYTDFYSSEEHATNVGSMFRDPKNALLPNWKHLPVGYHGRASSIVVSGTDISRPQGQIKLPDSDRPVFSPSGKLDFELEVAFITCSETQLGTRIPTDLAEEHIAGLVLFNDWSARDIQQWEYVPLGPFLGKNFASTISPWVVTLDALEPFRCDGPMQDPEVLPYLKKKGPGNFDIRLEVTLQPEGQDEVVVCRSNTRYLYWNMAQQLAHHTINGCNIRVGDLYASGTISGPSPGSFGSLLELSWNGARPLSMPDGSERSFLLDGDSVVMRGYASNAAGIRIGFGECRGKILPPKMISES